MNGFKKNQSGRFLTPPPPIWPFKSLCKRQELLLFRQCHIKNRSFSMLTIKHQLNYLNVCFTVGKKNPLTQGHVRYVRMWISIGIYLHNAAPLLNDLPLSSVKITVLNHANKINLCLYRGTLRFFPWIRNMKSFGVKDQLVFPFWKSKRQERGSGACSRHHLTHSNVPM